MAWFCSAKANKDLVANLLQNEIISNSRVVQAMESVDRKDFCARYAYDDSPQAIGYGATISAPHMHGYALENLEPYLQPGMKVLDIGSGSGYLSACMAYMVGDTGKVVGVEHIKELVDASIRNCRKSHSAWIDNQRLLLVEGDGRLGYPSEGPYDCIHVGAAAPSKPDALIDQLKSPGRLFIPVGTITQAIMIYDKDSDGKVSEKKWLDVQVGSVSIAKHNLYY